MRVSLLAPLPLSRPIAYSGLVARRTTQAFVLLSVFVALLFLMVLMLGSVNIPLGDMLRVLLGGEASQEAHTAILLKFRLPKALTALLAGGALGVAGLLMQTFFRNPLADPFILGISSGAGLGVALVVLAMGTAGAVLLTGIGLLGDAAIVVAAALGACAALGVVLLVARHMANPLVLLVVGLMFSYISSALISLLLFAAVPQRVQAYVNWGFGSFAGITWGQMGLFAGVLGLGLLLAYAMSKALNALLLGEAYARSLGLRLGQARLGIIVATGLLAGGVTAFCGPIGFIGVAVPHIARGILRQTDHRALIPASALVGGGLALLAALIAETPFSASVLPLNAITALIGAPIVVWVLLRQRSERGWAA